MITRDPDGVSVELTDERWGHVVDGQPELAPYRSAIVTAVEAPTKVLLGRAGNERWHYLQSAGPSRWLKVVVAYEGRRGHVVTAFARRSIP